MNILKAFEYCIRRRTGTGAAAVADDVPVEAVCSVGALEYCGKLRVADTSLLASGAHASWADAHLHDVGAGEEQLLYHLRGHHVPGLL